MVQFLLIFSKMLSTSLWYFCTFSKLQHANLVIFADYSWKYLLGVLFFWDKVFALCIRAHRILSNSLFAFLHNLHTAAKPAGVPVVIMFKYQFLFRGCGAYLIQFLMKILCECMCFLLLF